MERFSRRQFITGGAVAALGGTLALAGCAPSGSSNAKGSNGAGSGSSAGIGSGMGKHGQFDVEVMVTDGNLDRITVLNSRETPGMGDVAMEELTQLIVDNQTLNVDTVSGATLSSMAFIGAVSDALDQAGQKSSDWRKRDKATPAQTELPASADVVVVGGGGAGFAAAITAANAGKSVVLLEKMGVFGGDTALSGGEMAAPGNWIQVQEGIADSPDALAKDMLEGGDNAGDPALVQIIAEGALDSSQWLTFEGGISWKHDLMQFGGHNTKRSIIPITHSGSEMTTKLTKRAGEIDTLTLAKNSPAVELVKSGDAITGVKVKNTVTGEESTIACKAVVLASGGFGSVCHLQREVKFGNSRFDLSFQKDGTLYFMEVKGVTLEQNGTASFPDAPTERGLKHLLELQEAAREGYGAAVLFVIQMKDIRSFTPNRHTHPAFADALKEVSKHGVQILAKDCIVTEHSMTIDQDVPVIL